MNTLNRQECECCGAAFFDDEEYYDLCSICCPIFEEALTKMSHLGAMTYTYDKLGVKAS